MELKKVKGDGKTALVEVAGETFSVTNAIREELWEDSSVSEAAQVREHPYLAQPKVFVKMSKGTPNVALGKAADRIITNIKDFRESFKKALNK